MLSFENQHLLENILNGTQQNQDPESLIHNLLRDLVFYPPSSTDATLPSLVNHQLEMILRVNSPQIYDKESLEESSSDETLGGKVLPPKVNGTCDFKLPWELLKEVFKFIPLSTFKTLSLVNREWSYASSDFAPLTVRNNVDLCNLLASYRCHQAYKSRHANWRSFPRVRKLSATNVNLDILTEILDLEW